MLLGRLSFRARRYALLAVFALAVLVRGAVPSGWMLAADAETGHIEVQLCSGKWVNLDLGTGDYSDADPDQDSDHPQDPDAGVPCPFAMSSSAVDAVGISYDGVTDVWARTDVPRPSRGPPAARSNQVQLPARGPPISA